MYLFYVLFQWDLKSLNPNANTYALIEHSVQAECLTSNMNAFL